MHGREGRRRTTKKKHGSATRRRRWQLKSDRLKPVPHWLKSALPRLKPACTSQPHFGLEVTYVIYLHNDQTTPRSWLPIYMGHFPLSRIRHELR
jgi:hypothetical protein